MIVAPLALDRLDDDGANVDVSFKNKFPNFLFRFFLALNRIAFAFRLRQ